MSTSKEVKDLSELKRGSVVRNKDTGNSYVVDRTGPDIVAVSTVVISNPDEWVVVEV